MWHKRNQLLRAPFSVVGRRNSRRVDEGKKERKGLKSSHNKGMYRVGRGGEEPA